MHKYMFAIIIVFISATMALADNANEILAIEKTARDYMESWYQGNAKKMGEVLHKELAKRSLKQGFGDKMELRQTAASDMISYTKSGYGKSLWTKDMDIEVTILDFRYNIASVKVISQHYYEYLHLIKIDEKWVIINALYEKNTSIEK